MMHADVVIVGGGPAGCGAALALVQRGLTSVIISPSGRTNKITETSLPALARVLRALNAPQALEACEPCYGICSTWGRNVPALRPSILDPHGHAWFIHRARFDASLQHRTRELGVVWRDATAQSVCFEDERVLVSTSNGAVCARWLVAATGCPSWPARITQQEFVTRDSLIALWAHLSPSIKEQLLFVETTDLGWWYLCPDDVGGAVACFVTDAEAARDLGAAQPEAWSELFNATTLSDRLNGPVSVALVRGAFTGISFLPRKQGNRWIAIGDAAAKLDPVGSSGTVSALEVGRRAAAAIADGLSGDLLGLERYERWGARLVAEFEEQRGQHYLIERMNRASGFWERRSNYQHAAEEAQPAPALKTTMTSILANKRCEQ